MRFVRLGERGQERDAVLVDERQAAWLPSGDPAAGWNPEELARRGTAALDGGERVALDGLRWGAPLRPGKIVCVGLNYADHAAEGGNPAPDEPILFLKAPDTVVGPHDDVVIPAGGERTDWEVELGVVIGRPATALSEQDAAAHVAGYVLCNDVSERAFQLERGGQWDKGKNCATFCPLGPWFATADELPDPQALPLGLDVSGTPYQNSSTAQMIFSITHLVWYVSHFMTLYPGDVISTGTPAGVGAGQHPPVYLKPGDVMRAWAEGLGEQRCRLVPSQ